MCQLVAQICTRNGAICMTFEWERSYVSEANEQYVKRPNSVLHVYIYISVNIHEHTLCIFKTMLFVVSFTHNSFVDISGTVWKEVFQWEWDAFCHALQVLQIKLDLGLQNFFLLTFSYVLILHMSQISFRWHRKLWNRSL